jgi:hypothetical protein
MSFREAHTTEQGYLSAEKDTQRGDARLRTAALTNKNLGVDAAVSSFTDAARFYGHAISESDGVNFTTRAKELTSMEALVEAGVLDPEAVRIRINEGLVEADKLGASEEDIAPLLLVVAEVEAAKGEASRAQDILNKVNGHTPSTIAEEFATNKTINVSTLAEALLPEMPEAA